MIADRLPPTRDDHTRWLIGIVALGAALRFATLTVQSYDIDESVTVALLHQGLHATLNTIPTTEKTPPLYYILAWLWSRPFGLSEAGLRSFSALAGTLTIPLAYDAGRQLVSRRTGLITAALVAVSPFLIWYSQEARSYALLGLIVASSFALFARLLDRPSGRLMAAWAVASMLALATHYFAVFVIAPEAVWLLLRTRPRSRSVLAVGGIGAVGGGLLPLAIHQAHEFHGREGFLTTPLHSRITSVPVQFLLGPGQPAHVKVLLVSVAALAGFAGLLLLIRNSDPRTMSAACACLFVGAAAVLVPIALALAGLDYLDPRNLTAAWIPLAVVPAAGFVTAQRTGLVAVTALLVVSLATVLAVDTDEGIQRANYRGVASALGPSPGPGQRAIVVTPEFSWTPLAFYLPEYPRLSSGDVGVREVDLIGWEGSKPSPSAVMRLASRGFRLVEDHAVQKFRLVRFLAPEAISISRSDLEVDRLGQSGATVLIQAN